MHWEEKECISEDTYKPPEAHEQVGVNERLSKLLDLMLKHFWPLVPFDASMSKDKIKDAPDVCKYYTSFNILQIRNDLKTLCTNSNILVRVGKLNYAFSGKGTTTNYPNSLLGVFDWNANKIMPK